jgi:CheY-like chemotaxis protein
MIEGYLGYSSPLLRPQFLRIASQELHMILILILLLLGVFFGFITVALLSASSKKAAFKERHCLSVTAEQDTVGNLPHGLGNNMCLGTGAKRIQATTPKVFNKKGRILFVDDEEYLVDLVARMLRHLGYDVIARNSSLDALEHIKSEGKEFDLIIVDQVMPELSGTEFAKEAKRLQPKVPVILFTGFSDMIPQEKLQDLGIQELVTKPINLSDLSQVVNRVLSFAKTEASSITS